MADEPEGPSDRTEAAALGELARCETLAQTATWAARWSARLAGAEGALIWTPDAAIPIFVCVAAEGEGTRVFLRRSAPRETGTVHGLLRDRRPTALDRKDFASSPQDPWVMGFPAETETCLAIPLEAEGQVVGLMALLFEQPQKAEPNVAILKSFLRHAAPAFDRALKAEKKTVGMLQAIERLTNLYDLSKAFGSTIDQEELNGIIVRKAVDFGVAEVASFWLLEGETADVGVVLAGTAVNENYDVGNAPEAVGASIIGDLLAEQKVARRNAIPPEDPLARENEGYPVRSVLAFPLLEEEKPVGALVLVNKRGRHPEFTPDDEELLHDLARQAVRALRNARQYEAEKKVEELDALLTVSREITSTLDLGRVMGTIVNATSALIAYDRCAIAILEKGRLRLGAVSGLEHLDRKAPEHARLQALLDWVFLGGSDVEVRQEEDGSITADRPETQEKFRSYFSESGMRSFFGAILKDDEGRLGVLSFESKEPLVFGVETSDILQILVNQATVAVRNAQLYQQVPLVGFLKPLAQSRRRLQEIPRRKRQVWTIGLAAVILVLVVVPWRLRLSGPARVLPGRRAAVTAGVDGVVREVLKHEGEGVAAGDVIATLRNEGHLAALAEAQTGLAIAESAAARAQEEGNAAALFLAQSHRDELRARVALETENLEGTRLKAPIAGTIVTPRLEERVGQNLPRGGELCVVADVGSVTAEVAIAEEDATLLAPKQPADVKLNPFPTRTFHGTVSLVGARVREEGESRFVIAEVRIDNPEGSIKTGTVGRAKIRVGSRSIATLLLRRPARWLWAKVWPLLP
jgi:GAF domain-containing protein/biotin carboxyl carrier protein